MYNVYTMNVHVGVLCCFALFVCLFDLACLLLSFFLLISHLKTLYIHVYTCAFIIIVYTCTCTYTMIMNAHVYTCTCTYTMIMNAHVYTCAFMIIVYTCTCTYTMIMNAHVNAHVYTCIYNEYMYMVGWVTLPFFSYFFKLVCYAHVFPWIYIQ